jgi:hypothetical protein
VVVVGVVGAGSSFLEQEATRMPADTILNNSFFMSVVFYKCTFAQPRVKYAICRIFHWLFFFCNATLANFNPPALEIPPDIYFTISTLRLFLLLPIQSLSIDQNLMKTIWFIL